MVSFVITPVLSRALRAVVVRAADLTLRRQRAAAAALEFATERLTYVRTVQVGAGDSQQPGQGLRIPGASDAMSHHAALRCAAVPF